MLDGDDKPNADGLSPIIKSPNRVANGMSTGKKRRHTDLTIEFGPNSALPEAENIKNII